ncbi:hypothetical protein COEREDRAFT_87897 [Coemansia reversa NRRL 1564]|uniref:Coilin tudor domain-containing protein n=1 Tax=Coemansia reversa (strain ATCC 12441 / NRRL 1564) TaxID=763665 RepID=A0A2G5B927_COERN|nr:hypothetical protein COEREDRAFT_87897 [Coemansia reversa NRRL 1564]|eukprot:PIA15490.1 hypothetical protein COEREDRAFT_87897 [Coemansia reversa NRRL 1564]
MFMPGAPEITPEQEAAMRRDSAKGFLTFAGVVAAIRIAKIMEKKLTIVVKLDAPLPVRQFLMVCKQRTIKELKNEVKRRIHFITPDPITLLFDGFELMDDDYVHDILEPRSVLHVKRVKDIENAALQPNRPQVTISRKEHGNDTAALTTTKDYLAEAAYENSQPLSLSKTPSASDIIMDSSDNGSSSTSSSDEHKTTCKESIKELRRRIHSISMAGIDAEKDVDVQFLKLGEIVAFKLLEMTEDMTPSISQYRIGKVVDMSSGSATVQILRDLKPKSAQKISKGTSRRRAQLIGTPDQDNTVWLDPETIRSLKTLDL